MYMYLYKRVFLRFTVLLVAKTIPPPLSLNIFVMIQCAKNVGLANYLF